jgi:hypothetical protein
LNVQGLVVSHELLDEHLDLVRSDADALVRATREICPTVCMPESEHAQPDGRTVLRNHAVSRQEIEIGIMQDRMGFSGKLG